MGLFFPIFVSYLFSKKFFVNYLFMPFAHFSAVGGDICLFVNNV